MTHQPWDAAVLTSASSKTPLEVMPRTPQKRKRPSRLTRSRAVPAKATVAEIESALEAGKLSGITLTPLQLLAVILKIVLKERITPEEEDRICTVYYDTVKKWFT
jgi:hypothetical protein